MANHAPHSLASTFFIFLTILLLGGSRGNCEGLEAKQSGCGSVEGVAVLFGCLKSIDKEGPQVPPSADCCKGLKEIGTECTCQIITKEIEKIISMEKLVFVAQSCGHPLAPGTQCGIAKISNLVRHEFEPLRRDGIYYEEWAEDVIAPS